MTDDTKKPAERPSVNIENLQLYHITAKAWKVGPPGLPEKDDSKKIWLPISQIESSNILSIGKVGFVKIPAWLAEEKGIQV